MITKSLDTWEDFPEEIKKIRAQYGKHVCGDIKVENRILFRGQANADWELKTTLERSSSRTWGIQDYMNIAQSCAPRLESTFNRTWNLPEWPELHATMKRDHKSPFVKIPHYDYWVYLRHHGFPSPLLDWSKSPFIAAFFAFEEPEDTKCVAIFTYVESTTGGKGGFVGAPKISVQGPYVKTHERHYLQQAWYTIATEDKNNDHEFVPHESVFRKSGGNQDILIKLTIPVSERLKALNTLYDYNITRFSLFQTEEALVRTLAFQELESHGL
jgi:hypothetical protein